MKRRNFIKSMSGFLSLLVIPFVPIKSQYKSFPSTLESLYGMDAEKELTKMMTEEIRKEIIDEEILKRYNRPINKNYYTKIHIKAKEIL